MTIFALRLERVLPPDARQHLLPVELDKAFLVEVAVVDIKLSLPKGARPCAPTPSNMSVAMRSDYHIVRNR